MYVTEKETIETKTELEWTYDKANTHWNLGI